MKVTFKVIKNGDPVLTKVLGEGVYRVGRSTFSDILLDDDGVSRSHVEIRITESSIYATNMAPAGRLRLNGELIETGEAKDGDTLGIGPYQIQMVVGEVAEEIPAESAEAQEPVLQMDENGFGGDAVSEEPPADNVVDFASPEGAEAEAFDAPADNAPAALQEAPLEYEGTAALNRAQTVVEMKPVVAKLLFTEGAKKGEEISLDAYEVSFGRSKKADIFIDDEKLSRIHAKISRVGMGYRLIDMNSRNGTFVNGVRVLEHPLSSFDEIQIGNCKIKFLIHDLMSSDLLKGGEAKALTPIDSNQQTRSLQLVSSNPEARALAQAEPNQQPPSGPPISPHLVSVGKKGFDRKRRNVVLISLLAVALIVFFLLPSNEKPKVTPKAESAEVAVKGKEGGIGNDVLPANSIPKEFLDLNSDAQRAIESHYNSAIRSADQGDWVEALNQLKRIHDQIPYYKDSRDLEKTYAKKKEERRVFEAEQKAKRDEKQDLAIYLEDGLSYLKQGDFKQAGEAFNYAIALDPNNETAKKGLKAVEYRVRDFDKIPAEKDPEADKAKKVEELFQKAVAAFYNKSYQEAIDIAEQIRKIELKGNTQYLNEAKQIIDRARMLQKDLFEPFLIQAKEKYAEGDYNAARDLCEEMLKRDAAYDDAKELLAKSRKQLNRLAKEAYTHGYILESMNRIEEAKQYWNRAKNYVRPGDDYYEKVTKRLEYYQ